MGRASIPEGASRRPRCAERLLEGAEQRAADSGSPGDVALARQAARRVADLREREERAGQDALAQPATGRARLAAIDVELEQRAARTARVAELAPAEYLLTALGPRPERPAQRAQWRQAAWRIDQARDATGYRDSHDALGTAPRDRRVRELWDDARREIARYRREVDPALEPQREASSERELG